MTALRPAPLRRTAVARLPVAVAFLLIAPLSARAHDAGITSVARVFLSEWGDGRYSLSVPDTGVPPFGEAKEVLPSHCRLAPVDGAPAAGSRWVFECERALTFDDDITLPWTLGVVAVASWADGSEASAYFEADGRTVTVRLAELRAAAGSGFRLAERYFALGAEHILLGVDHLLFVLGLLLLVRSAGSLVKTITAFTLAHSLTLGASVLGLVSVDPGPAEAAIALSIVLLAREIVAARQGAMHLVHRRPWLVAFAFGLLHGLGFAGALGRIGLRSGDIPAALLFFNLGVEAGQLAFVAAALAVHRTMRALRRPALARVKPALGYSLGTLATLWFFLRLPAIWGP
jgi:hydrogenase/urease accessory protein HupE